MEREFDVLPVGTDWSNDGMACIVASGASRADVDIGTEDIGELAFALIPPLGTENGSNSCEWREWDAGLGEERSYA